MNLSLGFSPCPNDTFIFDALVNNKIDGRGLTFDVILEDVQTLNQLALEGRLDITKISYAVLPLILDNYIVLNSGSALGRGVGPLLIKNEKLKIKNVEDHLIAIPGEHTTAHLLFSLAYPNAKNKIFLRYDKIEEFVLKSSSQISPFGVPDKERTKFLEGAGGLGVIIHENRFTYRDKGLHKIIDLGDYWETKTNNPIPLGGIVIRRNINSEVQRKVDRLIRKSIEYAYSNYPELNDYIRSHSQEMSEEVMRKHIDLYVNDFSIDLGNTGKTAVQELLNIYQYTNNYKPIQHNEIFLSPTQP